ncbi:nicotinate-nucleotide adenylyltransferase [Asticcacaulis endophyticus]|uniref:Probable nicotinate-nucleotide adenylyltransferase n=1 Tax=Asticcacaulis endophyticus TaxID=1395890 RepID=A0A918PTN6_9CAUL|nr:nicotinate-nucleotide adenylyltransferase [Asticcacaulis endophyticus]GGZ22837.1 putative nicotinate-nucleotide adenylyltransferase [Asticcacaulis endophyticus]
MWFAGPAPLYHSVRPGALRTGLHLERGMTIGLFGGSFNPAHEGHAHVANTARIALGLDKIIWLVSPQNPLKSNHETAPLSERIDAIRPFIGPRDIISDFETRIKANYTLDTLRALKARYPGVRFVWIMGGDSLASFHRWRGWTQIAHMIPMAIVSRPGALMNSRFSPTARRFAHARHPQTAAKTLARQKVPAWTYLTGPLHTASSTALRNMRRKAVT